jgi:acyl carrier protein phosphodiesterase
MNFLAHAFLSFGDPEITVGNLISDFVKGKRQYEYPPGIRNGIILHRSIDSFTDNHPASIEAKQVFRAHYRLYAAAFVDVTYDHFLASDAAIFPDDSLKSFSNETYSIIEPHIAILPDRFSAMFPYMKSQDWFYNYQFKAGLEKSFGGLVRRARYMDDSITAMTIFEQHHDLLRDCYRSFMPDVRDHAASRIQAFK